ncbi:MAG: CDP-diacylglycerol--glycerol-3-phosphate 3-phosphatidyltransferase [Enterobacteriaceae bacterium]
MFNLPTFVTLFRFFLTPIFVITFYLKKKICLYIFFFASITDFLDGLIARKFNKCTKIGELLDLLADKIIIFTGYLLIIEKFSSYLITLPVIFMICRELIVTTLREYCAKTNIRTKLSSVLGKIKTVFQMVSILILLNNNIKFNKIGFILLYISMLFSTISAIIYFIKFKKIKYFIYCKITK